MERLQEDSFTWSRWRAFNLVSGRYFDEYKNLFKKYAVGYIDAERLRCRPKCNHYAVMFLKDDVFSWVHLTSDEFKDLIGE